LERVCRYREAGLALDEIRKILDGPGGKLRRSRALTKKRWVALLRASGLNDDDMHQWHVEFERMEPEAHRDFLESLGIPKAEVRSIRAWSRQGDRIRPA